MWIGRQLIIGNGRDCGFTYRPCIPRAGREKSLPVLFFGVLSRSAPALFLALFYRPVKDVKRRSGCYNERTGSRGLSLQFRSSGIQRSIDLRGTGVSDTPLVPVFRDPMEGL